MDALSKPAIPAGTVKVKAPRKRTTLEQDLAQFHKPVRLVQPPAGRWKCDTCAKRGTGGKGLLAHSGVTGHLRFTDLDYK